MSSVFPRLVAVTVLLLMLSTGTALAETRAGAGNDPRDVPESLNGPRRVDIEHVRVVYDSAGSLTVTMRLYEPYGDTSRSDTSFDVSIGSSVSSYGYSCSAGNSGDVYVSAALNPAGGKATARVSGYDGTLTADASSSPDGRETTYTFSHGAIAGRGYICATNISVYRPDPDGHCVNNCERISYRYTGDTADEFFFEGFAPRRRACSDGIDNDGDGRTDWMQDQECRSDSMADTEGPSPTACANGRDDDGDGRVDGRDPGCARGASDTSEQDPAPVASRFALSVKARRCALSAVVEVLPDLKPARLFPFGKVEIRVRGLSGRGRGLRRTRRLPLGDHPGYDFLVRAGRYRVTGRYLGDPYRRRSIARTRTVIVSPRTCGR